MATELSIIVAHDKNLVIGNNGTLPWRIPEDLKHFKQTTMGSPLLMGRGVFEELNCKPLPGRDNYVLTSRNYDNVICFKSIPEAVEFLQKYDKVFVIGGGEIYRQMLDMANELIVTEIHAEYDGDTFFPEYRNDIGQKWIETKRTDFSDYSFVTYKRS